MVCPCSQMLSIGVSTPLSLSPPRSLFLSHTHTHTHHTHTHTHTHPHTPPPTPHPHTTTPHTTPPTLHTHPHTTHTHTDTHRHTQAPQVWCLKAKLNVIMHVCVRSHDIQEDFCGTVVSQGWHLMAGWIFMPFLLWRLPIQKEKTV